MQASQPVPLPHAISSQRRQLCQQPRITSSPRLSSHTSSFKHILQPKAPLQSAKTFWFSLACLGFQRGYCGGFSWCIVSRAWTSSHIALPPPCDYRDGFMVWVETQVLGAKEFAEVVKEWHVSLHCHILFNFLLLAKDRQLLMFLFCSLFRWDLFGHYRHHCHPHSFGFENPLLGWAGLALGLSFFLYGVLCGFGTGYVGWCIGNVQHSRYAHLSSDLLRNPALLVPYTIFFLILGWAMSDALKMCNTVIGMPTYPVTCWEVPHFYFGDYEVPGLPPILGSLDCESCCPPFIVSLVETQTGREWFLWRFTSERLGVGGIFTWTLKDHHQEWGFAHGVNLEVILLGMDPHSEVANEFGCSSVVLSRNDKPFLTYKRRKCDKPSSARCCLTTFVLLCVCMLVHTCWDWCVKVFVAWSVDMISTSLSCMVWFNSSSDGIFYAKYLVRRMLCFLQESKLGHLQSGQICSKCCKNLTVFQNGHCLPSDWVKLQLASLHHWRQHVLDWTVVCSVDTVPLYSAEYDAVT